MVAPPGATELVADLRADSLEEIRLYELRHGEARGQTELASRLAVTQRRSPSSSTTTTFACRRCASTSMRSARFSSELPCSTTRIAGCRSTADATMQPGRTPVSTVSARLAPTNADERAVSVGSCLVQQAYNTTSTYGIPPTPTTALLVGLESPGDEGERRRAPTSSHGIGTLITRRSRVQIPPPPLR